MLASCSQKGKKLLARGRFKIAKFSLGDDEIDYELVRSEKIGEAEKKHFATLYRFI